MKALKAEFVGIEINGNFQSGMPRFYLDDTHKDRKEQIERLYNLGVSASKKREMKGATISIRNFARDCEAGEFVGLDYIINECGGDCT